jgi:hypothetical protein
MRGDFEAFGEAMWKLISRPETNFCGDEWSEEVLPLAQQAGLCERVPYDPAIHGEDIEADPGDEIWWWGEANVDVDLPDTAAQDSASKSNSPAVSG